MHDLTRRADCHASGTAATAAVIAKGDLEPVNLCAHCVTVHADELVRQGWIIERLKVGAK